MQEVQQQNQQQSFLALPAKRYFSRQEVLQLLGIADHILQLWEKTFLNVSLVKSPSSHSMFKNKRLRQFYLRQEVLVLKRLQYLIREEPLLSRLYEHALNENGDIPMKAYWSIEEMQGIQEQLKAIHGLL
jgi:hypothetical protein